MNNEINLHPLKDVSIAIKRRRISIITRQGYLDLLKNILIMVIIIYLAFTQVFYITAQVGTDMYPAILDGDIVLGYRLDSNYVKNDVVVCNVNGEKVIG